MSLKKPDKDKLLKDLAPRQRTAIGHPMTDETTLPEPTMRRVNGNVQSILTFDVARIDKLEGAPQEVLDRAVDGWFAVWHGRVTTFPVLHVDEWDRLTIAMAEGIIKRLVSGVGLDEDIEVHNGSDLKSIHVYKWATHEELRLSEHLIGKTFTALEAGSDV